MYEYEIRKKARSETVRKKVETACRAKQDRLLEGRAGALWRAMNSSVTSNGHDASVGRGSKYRGQWTDTAAWKGRAFSNTERDGRVTEAVKVGSGATKTRKVTDVKSLGQTKEKKHGDTQ